MQGTEMGRHSGEDIQITSFRFIQASVAMMLSRSAISILRIHAMILPGAP